MTDFLIRLLITIGVIWLTEFLLTQFNIGEPARKIISIVVIIVMLLFLIGVYYFYPIR